MNEIGKIKRKDNIFKRWYRLANPSKRYFAGQVIFYSLYTIVLALFTIFAAKTINAMYAGDWNMAFRWLGLELADIIVRNLFMHAQYECYALQCGYVRSNVTQKIYKKFLSCKKKELDDLSKEKVTNIALNNMAYIAEFSDTIAISIGVIIQVVLTLVIVFSSNVLAGLIIMALGVVNFFAYYHFNKKLGRILLKRYEKKDDLFKSYSKVIDGRIVINELNAQKKYEDDILQDVSKFNKAYSEYHYVASWKGHLWFAIWHVVVYAIAAFLMYKVSNGTLGIEIYLIIVPYLTSCTEKLNVLWDKTNVIENMRVDVDRVNLILSLSDEELVQYGNVNKENADYNLALIDVSKAATGDSYGIINANIQFERGKINVIKGPKDNGKRVIFNLLRRYSVPDNGTILLDNLNLYDYNNSTFKTHINYCASHPTFIRGSIRENLTLVNNNFKVAQNLCKKIGITDQINALPKKYDTSIVEIDDSGLLFMLGLVRALLSNCKVLMIYEIPDDTPERFRNDIQNLLLTQNTDKTIILFTHSNNYDEIAHRIYNVKEGVVSQVK